MEEREADQHSPEHPHQSILRQPREGNRRFSVNLPWWHSPFVGYVGCILLMGTVLLVFSIERLFSVKPHVSNALLSLVTILVALLWGVGPALFAIVLGLIILGIFIISPSGLFTSDFLDDMVMYGPWLLGELIVIVIVAQREKAQRRAFVAELRVYEREKQLENIFISRASHELKTPITTIRAQTQLGLRRLARLQSTSSELNFLHLYLEKIDTQTYRLQALIDDLLDVNSLHLGKMPLPTRAV